MFNFFLPTFLLALGAFLQAEICVYLHSSLANHLGICFPCFCPALCCATYPFDSSNVLNLTWSRGKEIPKFKPLIDKIHSKLMQKWRWYKTNWWGSILGFREECCARWMAGKDTTSKRELLSWLHPFFGGHIKRVQLGDELLALWILTCGGPRGSSVSLILFNININPLGRSIRDLEWDVTSTLMTHISISPCHLLHWMLSRTWNAAWLQFCIRPRQQAQAEPRQDTGPPLGGGCQLGQGVILVSWMGVVLPLRDCVQNQGICLNLELTWNFQIAASVGSSCPDTMKPGNTYVSLILLPYRFCNAFCSSSRVGFLLYSFKSFFGECNIHHFLCQTCQILGERLQVGDVGNIKGLPLFDKCVCFNFAKLVLNTFSHCSHWSGSCKVLKVTFLHLHFLYVFASIHYSLYIFF